MRSLYSGVSGLKTHQTKMDVIGNNIANVNTVGFKSSSVLFKDVLYQTTQSATGANAETGAAGTNAIQIGLGSSLASVANNTTKNGSAQSTNNPYDLMLNGESFFIVSRGGINYFTKVGSFTTDDVGNLVTSSGELVMGWQVDPDNPNNIKKDSVSALSVESVENKYASPEQTSKLYLSGNVDLTDPNLTTTEGAIQTVTIYDNLGYSYTVKMKINQDTAATNEYNVSIVSIKDSDNNDILQNGYSASLSETKLKFDADSGAFVGIGTGKESQLTITPNDDTKGDVFRTKDNTGAYSISSIGIDFSSLTMFAQNGKCTAKLNRGGLDKTGAGRTVGELSDVSIGTDGKIYGVYDNGVTKLLGQIAVAQFTNPAGLESIGGSLYKTTQNSGDFDGIGQEVTAGGGKMTQGVLEMSNVDLSQEFTEMITTQRGFQANSRIITTSDSMLEELVNLKR